MQIPDMLVWRGVEHIIVAGSLGFKTVFPDVVIPKFERICSACWRGYIETWMIDHKDWLRIARIDYFADSDEDGVTANQLYSLISNHDSPIAALPFTGEVTAGYDEDVQSHGRYEQSYPNYRVLSFQDGKLTHFEEHDRAWWVKDHEVSGRLRDFLRNTE